MQMKQWNFLQEVYSYFFFIFCSKIISWAKDKVASIISYVIFVLLTQATAFSVPEKLAITQESVKWTSVKSLSVSLVLKYLHRMGYM